MALKFRLRGLAETFVDEITCPCCGHTEERNSESGLQTEHTKVTLSGIVVVVKCISCSNAFIPSGQKFGVINSQRLHAAVERDSRNTGQPVFQGVNCVTAEVERINATKDHKFH